MSIEMKAEYKGYVIEFYSWNRKFVISKNGERLKQEISDTDAAQKWIDDREKVKYKRVAVITLNLGSWGQGEHFENGEATSLIDNECAWVMFGKKRSKEKIEGLYLDTPENRQKTEQINVLWKERDEKDKQADKLIASLEKLKPEMME